MFSLQIERENSIAVPDLFCVSKYLYLDLDYKVNNKVGGYAYIYIAAIDL